MFYLFLCIGIFYVFGSIFTSNWNIIASGPIDGQLTNYILEHFYLVLTHGSPIHTHWWTLPIFYPNVNTLATTDTLFSVAPIYLLLRTVFDYSMSYSMTVMAFYILNFSVFYFILKKLKFSKFLSALGAFIYAFSYVNKITIIHIQLITQFFGLGAILSLMYVSKFNTKKKNFILFMSVSFLYVCQFYSSFYIAFFMFFLCVLGSVISLFQRNTRKKLMIFLCRYKKEILSSIVLMLAFILPAVGFYLTNGVLRDYFTVNSNLPYLNDLFTGHTFFIMNIFPSMDYTGNIEIMLLFPYLLLVTGILGLLKYKNYGKLLVSIFLIVCIFIIKFECLNGFSLWQYVYDFFPGATGIREPIRMMLLLNILLVVGFINFISKSYLKKWILYPLILFIIFEQYTTISFNSRSYEKEENTLRTLNMLEIPENCKYLDVNFYIENPKDVMTAVRMDEARLDTMWFANERNLYFVSGYSGVSESNEYKNKYREELQTKPEYCVISKRLRDFR